jgi:polysaccharide biosynthesis protein VpsM
MSSWSMTGHALRAATALALGVVAVAPTADALDLDLKGVDGINTETVASRDRLKVWDNIERYGANTVTNIDRRDVSPDGLHSGNYLIFPSIGAAVVFDDNIFALNADKRADFRSEITPSIQFKSQLPRHVLDFSMDGKIVTYAENPDQDYENYRAKVDGALHFDHAHTVSASVSSVLNHEERDDPLFSFSAAEPIPVYQNRIAAGITRDVGRLYGTWSASAEHRDYHDVQALDGSRLDQDVRDASTFSTGLKLGYRYSPGYELITKFRATKIDNRGDGLIDRDSLGFEAVAGLAFETNPLLRWRLLGGYGVRDYENGMFDDIATSLVQADVQWLPTPRLTVYASVYRQLEDALDLSSAGILQTGGKSRFEYELYHSVVLTGGVEFRQDEFKGTDRLDEVYVARLGLDYFYTKNWLFTFGYEHQVRDSSDDSLDMDRNRFTIGAKLRF